MRSVDPYCEREHTVLVCMHAQLVIASSFTLKRVLIRVDY